MAHNAGFDFNDDLFGDFPYDQVDNTYLVAPQVSSPGEAVHTEAGRIDLGTFTHAPWAGPSNIEQSFPVPGTLPNGGMHNALPCEGAVSSNHVSQWSQMQDPWTVYPNFQNDDGRQPAGGPGPAKKRRLNGFTSENNQDRQDHGHQETRPFPQNFKRRISEVDDVDLVDHSASLPQGPRRKRVKPSMQPQPQAKRSRYKSIINPDQTMKRKTITRPARKDKVQGTKCAEHNPKGMIGTNLEGELQWRETPNADWELAAYHNDVREELIAADEMVGGSYDQEPVGGGDQDPLNITSYCPSQRHWTNDKSTVLDAQGRKVLYLLNPPEDWVHNPKVGQMRHNGRVLLDHDDYPVRDFADVPKVLSTHIEPFRLEGLRRCYGMTVDDCRARMPSRRIDGQRIESLQTPQAFTNRANKWRVAENVGVWLDRQGSEKFKEYIRKQLASSDVETTEGLQNLTPEEQKAVFKLDKGKCRNKSRYEHPTQDTIAPPGGSESSSTGERKKYDRRNKGKTPAGLGLNGTNGTQRVPAPAVAPSQPGPSRSNGRVPEDSSSGLNSGVLNEVVTGIDYRFAVPDNAVEATSIQAALYYTRADYAYWMGEEAPATQPFDYYTSQYLQLQYLLITRWDNNRGEVPELLGVEPWFGGWDSWQKPIASEEVFSRLLSRP